MATELLARQGLFCAGGTTPEGASDAPPRPPRTLGVGCATTGPCANTQQFQVRNFKQAQLDTVAELAALLEAIDIYATRRIFYMKNLKLS